MTGREPPPELVRGGAVPMAEQIATWLRLCIRAGDFQPDLDRLPSEKQLTEMFGVSRPTARTAIRALRDDGLIYTVPHRGSYVRRIRRIG